MNNNIYSQTEKYNPKWINWFYLLFKAKIIQILEFPSENSKEITPEFIIKGQVGPVPNSVKGIIRKKLTVFYPL